MEDSNNISTGSSSRKKIDFSKFFEEGFKDFNISFTEHGIFEDTIPELDKLNLPKEKDIEDSSIDFDVDLFDEFDFDISSSSENQTNQRRLEILRDEFSNDLLNCLLEEDFEFGFTSRSELIIKEQFQVNALATRNWLNELYIENFANDKILIGLLRIIGRFNEEVIFPQGQTMALAALNHQNDEIKELGIRAFENWNSINSYEVLKKIQVEQQWLREYLEQVIAELSEELCLS